MALTNKAALLAVMLGATMPVAAGAQTAPATPAPTTSAPTTPAPTTPATPDAAGAPAATPAPDAATPPETPPETPPATPTNPAGVIETPTAPAGIAPAATAPVAAPGTPGQPVPTREQAQVGGFYLDSTQVDWQVRCQKTETGQEPCELYQLMRDTQNNPVAEISLIPLTGNAAAGVTIVAPLETDLLPGLGFKVDSGNAVAYPFSFCAQVGCFSRVAMSQAEIDALRRGSAGTVTLVPYGAPEGTKVDLGLSLKGFTAGWDAVKAKGSAPTETGPTPNAAPASTPAPNPAPAPVTPPAN